MWQCVKYSLILLLIASSHSYGHNLKLASVLLEQQPSNQWHVSFKVTHPEQNVQDATVEFPDHCTRNSPIRQESGLRTVSKSWQLRCDSSIQSISIKGINDSGTQLVTHIALLDRPEKVITTRRIKNNPLIIELPNGIDRKNTSSSTQHGAKHYLLSGFDHIMEGKDHLAFLFLILLLSYSFKKLATIVTGFTVGHALTLTMISTNMLPNVYLQQNTIECLIALSIIFLATEILRKKPTLTLTHPASIAALFGLVHGLGFASVLQSIALPNHHQVIALLSFNLGVELAQLGFIAFCFYLLKACRQFMNRWRWDSATKRASIKTIIAYMIGSMGSYWVVLRLISS